MKKTKCGNHTHTLSHTRLVVVKHPVTCAAVSTCQCVLEVAITATILCIIQCQEVRESVLTLRPSGEIVHLWSSVGLYWFEIWIRLSSFGLLIKHHLHLARLSGRLALLLLLESAAGVLYWKHVGVVNWVRTNKVSDSKYGRLIFWAATEDYLCHR